MVITFSALRAEIPLATWSDWSGASAWTEAGEGIFFADEGDAFLRTTGGEVWDDGDELFFSSGMTEVWVSLAVDAVISDEVEITLVLRGVTPVRGGELRLLSDDGVACVPETSLQGGDTLRYVWALDRAPGTERWRIVWRMPAYASFEAVELFATEGASTKRP